MMINVARMLWAYDIRKGWEEVDGRKMEVKVDSLDFVSGFNSPPLPFKADFVPRSDKVPDVLREGFEEAEKDTAAILERIEQAQQALKEGEAGTR
jgi:hypothetical protein